LPVTARRERTFTPEWCKSGARRIALAFLWFFTARFRRVVTLGPAPARIPDLMARWEAEGLRSLLLARAHADDDGSSIGFWDPATQSERVEPPTPPTWRRAV
jgi:hypothetical protein